MTANCATLQSIYPHLSCNDKSMLPVYNLLLDNKFFINFCPFLTCYYLVILSSFCSFSSLFFFSLFFCFLLPCLFFFVFSFSSFFLCFFVFSFLSFSLCFFSLVSPLLYFVFLFLVFFYFVLYTLCLVPCSLYFVKAKKCCAWVFCAFKYLVPCFLSLIHHAL